MTPRQQQFVEAYVATENAAEAYKRAGYKGIGKTASNGASRLMADLTIRAAVEEGLRCKREEFARVREAAANADALAALPHQAKSGSVLPSAEAVLREASIVAFSDLGEMIDSPILKAMPEHARRAISSIKVKRYTDGKGEDAKPVEEVEIKLWDKGAGISSLMKCLGMLKEKTPLEELLNALNAVNPAFAGELRRLLVERHLGRGTGPALPGADH
jgi:hypothetical protein